MKKQNLWWTFFLLMMFLSLGTLQAQTTYETLTYPSGAKYVGEVKDGMKNGLGTWTHPDGTVWSGRWSRDEFRGRK